DYLAHLRLQLGKGSGAPGERCAIQEVRAWLDLDASTDEIPDCVSKVCGRFMIRFQDSIKDDALRVKLCAPLLVQLVGSRASSKIERQRAWVAVDWVTREIAPLWLDQCPELGEHAAALRGLPEITSQATADAARPVREAARKAAWALRDEKWKRLRAAAADAYAAAAAAADADAYAAAAAAADAYAAAAAAAGAYADAAAAAAADGKRIYDAILALLNETRVKVWESGARCLEKMLAVGRE